MRTTAFDDSCPAPFLKLLLVRLEKRNKEIKKAKEKKLKAKRDAVGRLVKTKITRNQTRATSLLDGRID